MQIPRLLCCVGIFYLFVDLAVLVENLGVSIGLEVLLLYAGGFAAGIVNVAAIVVNVKKRKTFLQAGNGSIPTVMKILKPPYVCNGCTERHGCKLQRHLYDAKYAQKEYEHTCFIVIHSAPTRRAASRLLTR